MYKSPAAAMASDLYSICVGEGVEPAVALAFYVHESSAGTAGLTAQYGLKNWGNVRTPEDAALGTVVSIPGRGNFAKYPTWQNGLLDWCKRLKGPKYAGSGLVTAEQVLPKYAPGTDGNSPARYAEAVRGLVAAWQAAEPAPAAQPKPTTRWQCVNKQGVNLRTAPNTGGRIVRAIAYGETIGVDLVKTDGDVEAVRGDNRWLHAVGGEGFAWAGNFRGLRLGGSGGSRLSWRINT